MAPFYNFSIFYKMSRKKMSQSTHAPYGVILDHFVEYGQARALCTSPFFSFRAQPLSPSGSSRDCDLPSRLRSRLHLNRISHLEIASRSQIRHQATHRRNRIAERAEHAPEISRTPGFDRRRRTGRERWCFTHPVHTARLVRLSLRAQKTPCEPGA